DRDQQARQRARQLALRGLEFLERHGVVERLGRELDGRGAGPRARDFLQHRALLRGEALHGLDQIGNEIGPALIHVLDLRPLLADVLVEDDELIVDRDGPGADPDDQHGDHDQGDEGARHGLVDYILAATPGVAVKEAHTDSQERLPEYHVKARNTSASSENKIHDEQIARHYGFRGALVPGVTVYAYLTHPLVEAFGAAWLERGTANVRFLKPIHDGEEVALTGVVTPRDAKGLTAAVTATTAEGGECATLAATLPAGLPVAVNLAQYRVAPLPADRPTATREHLGSLDVLGTPINPYD